MKLYHIRYLLFISIFTALFSQPAFSAQQGPVAAVAEPEFKFDTIIEGHDIEHSFVIKNSGSEPLAILDVRTD